MVMVMTKAKHLDVTQARRALSLKQASSGENTTPFSILFTHGSLVVEVYQPMTTDHQKPHDRDECYVIIEGHGNFEMGDEIISFGPGDFLVCASRPAASLYQFWRHNVDMGMFYGPNGGENANSTEKTG